MVLIQRTTERNAVLAMDNLKEDFSLDILMALPVEELQEKIRPAVFYTSKSQTIKTLAPFIQDAGGFDVFESQETESLRKDLMALKDIVPETADVILFNIFDRLVFVADEYARSLFACLGFGEYKTYEQLKQASQDMTQRVDQVRCTDWHAVIDVHGKEYRRIKGEMDETWLLV